MDVTILDLQMANSKANHLVDIPNLFFWLLIGMGQVPLVSTKIVLLRQKACNVETISIPLEMTQHARQPPHIAHSQRAEHNKNRISL